MKTILMVVLLAVVGCASQPKCPPPRVHHVVLCWLKDAGNAGHRQRIIDVSRSFRTIPGVLDVRVGSVLESDRGIADDSFDVAIVLSFAGVEQMQAYLLHPDHEKAKHEVLLPIVSRIVVHDFGE